MKKQFFGYLIIGLVFAISLSKAQNKVVPEKKNNGIEYLQYTVQASEGLYAIARKFDTSPEEISKTNPEIKDGLKVGQRILIPTKKKNPERKIVPQIATVIPTKVEFTEHQVIKRQTIFAISRKYDVSQEDLKKYNPELESGLRDGMILRIPHLVKGLEPKEQKKSIFSKPDKSTSAQLVNEKKKTVLHLVQSDETLYSISRKYKVEVAEIIKLNPASAEKLSIGTELIIPTDANFEMQKKDTVPALSKEEESINKLFDTSLLTNSSHKNRLIRIAFMLPFMLNQDKKDPTVDRFVDFYAGALLAIQAAKQKGMSFEIYCYDTEKSEEKLTEVLANSELKTMDLIIGPAFSNQISLISDFSKENRINTLVPFSSKVADIDSNPYLFQFNPGTETELSSAIDIFTGKYKNMHLIFAEISGISSMDEGKIWSDGLKKALKNANKGYSTIQLTSSEGVNFANEFKVGEKNLVIFNTDKYAYASSYIKLLTAFSNEYNVMLFEQYSWKNQPDKLPSGMYFSAFKASINPDKLSAYNKEYIQYYGKSISLESPRYDLLGYDLTNYFVSIFNKFGSKFSDKIGTYNFTDGLQSKPMFERISNGSGFVNQQVYLIEE